MSGEYKILKDHPIFVWKDEVYTQHGPIVFGIIGNNLFSIENLSKEPATVFSASHFSNRA